MLVIEDGPTTTHGGVPFGAGVLAARQHGAAALVDPRPWAVGSIAATFEQYPDTGPLLPAMGYGDEQIRDEGRTFVPAELGSGTLIKAGKKRVVQLVIG